MPEIKVTKAITVTPSLWKEVQKMAKQADRSMSWMVNQLLTEALSARENSKGGSH